MHNQHDRRSHAIRLSSVWEPPAAGATAWVRRFGRPSGLDPGDRVLLVIERACITAISLNAGALPCPAPDEGRWVADVTALLLDRNLLAIEPSGVPPIVSPDSIDAQGRTALPQAVGRVSLEILTPPAGDG